MTALLNLLLLLLSPSAHAIAPSGGRWLTIVSPHFRVHHTPPLEPYARALTQALERALPELERRLSWKAPDAVDVIVEDPTDSANGLAMNFPNTNIELYSAPFAADSVLSYYVNWPNELATHELTHIVANDTTLGVYSTLRSIFGSWVKPNGLQPTWITEGLAVFQETSLTPGGRGRSPLTEAILREAVLSRKLGDPSYISLDRLNEGVPWWPGGNTQYILGYAIQALPTKATPNLPGRLSYENADTFIFMPNRALKNVNGQEWADVWSGATARLQQRYQSSLPPLPCKLTDSGRFTGGQAISSDGWVYFSEESWDHGFHLARARAEAKCDENSVERLERKPYSGPTQMAVSPSGAKVAYSAADTGFETLYNDIYLWNRGGGVDRITTGKRTRDPAFFDENLLLYVRVNADTSEAIVGHDLRRGKETLLFTARPFERISGLFSRGGRVLFSLHSNNGHEKIHELKRGKIAPLIPVMNPAREFERNPFLAADGSLYFAASYEPDRQEIYRLAPGAHKPERVLGSRSGYLDRPLVLADGKTLLVQDYGLNGLDLTRSALQVPVEASPRPAEDLHQFLTGEAPPAPSSSEIPLPPSVPYSAFGTAGTSLWPQYWFPEISAAQNGFLAGASTGGNDPLNHHAYFAIAEYDSRAKFPVFDAYYRNRSYMANFQIEASQTNNYFLSSKVSNRNTTYSAETIFSLWALDLAFGGAYREKFLFGSRSRNTLAFQNIGYARAGQTPSAIAPNWGLALSNFFAVYPSTSTENTFLDTRPTLQLFTRGFHPSHSVSLSGSAGITTNEFLASNYYQGGGPSPLGGSSFVVRGYPTDALFGQRIATANLSYTLPLAHPYRGLGTNPVFLETIGLRLTGDAGTANYLAVYSGNDFLYYERGIFGRRVIYGAGADLTAAGSIFYRVPLSASLGLHYGTEKRYGGGSVVYFALGVGLSRGGVQAGPKP
jgi:hypothetical protein